MNNKGVVLRMEDKSLIIMRNTGQIDTIPRGKRICEVGEEIIYMIPPRSSIKGLVIAIIGLSAALIVCFFLVLKLAGVSSSDEVIAYVSIDIKPSIEMGIDENEIVRELRGISSDSEEWIKDINYEDKSLEDVTAIILDKAEKGSLAKSEGEIVVAASIKTTTAKISDVVLANKLKEQVSKHIQDAHPSNAKEFIQASFAVPDEIRTMANVQKSSMGQYAVYLKMKSNGSNLQLEEIKDKTLRELEKEVKGLVAMLTSTEEMSKGNLSELLQDDKSGKLDEDLINKPSTEAPSGTKKPVATPKPTPKPTMKPTGTPSGTTKPAETPTSSKKPTGTPSETGTPKTTPSGSSKPTNTPENSIKPSPTASPKSTETPKPTSTPKPTPKPTTSPAESPKESDAPSVG